ncbi:MAG: MarR family winged helix-turn-helix transcriptional regulator [Burkholderiaceae bacterium]
MPPTKMTAESRAPRAKKMDPDTAPSTLVLRQFRMVFNAVKAHFRLVEKKTGIGGAQVWALSVIKSNPGIGMNDLAHSMDVHQSTASNLVKSLVERGMIVVSKDGTDKRAVTLRVSAAGTKVLRGAPMPFTGILPDALASLDARTLARLEKDLGKLIQVLEADERGANIPLADS